MTWSILARDKEGRLGLAIAAAVIAEAGQSIFLLVLSFNLLGDGLRDALDPRQR